MMGKGFLERRSPHSGFLLTLALLACAAVSGKLFAAEVQAVRVAATDSGTRVVLDLSAPVKHKAFLLDSPGRVVLDVARASLKHKLALPEAEGVVKAARSGKLPNNGLRLVFEVEGTVTF